MSEKTISVKLRVWRQAAQDQPGRLVDYVANNLSADMSFLEMLDVVNEDLIRKGEDAIAFDSDCREGICGSCGLMINGIAHGPDAGATTCQLHMRRFRDGETITVEPWRAKAFPVLKDLTVDRRAFDRMALMRRDRLVHRDSGTSVPLSQTADWKRPIRQRVAGLAIQ